MEGDISQSHTGDITERKPVRHEHSGRKSTLFKSHFGHSDTTQIATVYTNATTLSIKNTLIVSKASVHPLALSTFMHYS